MRIPSCNVYQWKMPGAISCMGAQRTTATGTGSAPVDCHAMLRQGLKSLLCALALGAVLAPPALADPPPPGSKWSQAYIDEADGTQLHADVLRPANLPGDAKTPVILSIGPYFNHSGQTGAAGPVEDTPFDPVTANGPSSRFYD